MQSPIPNDLPYNDFFEYYAPDFKLHLTPTSVENKNSLERLQGITASVCQNLKHLQAAPSVQMQAIPPDSCLIQREDAHDREDRNVDIRLGGRTSDGQGEKREHPAEFYSGDFDNDRSSGNKGNNILFLIEYRVEYLFHLLGDNDGGQAMDVDGDSNNNVD